MGLRILVEIIPSGVYECRNDREVGYVSFQFLATEQKPRFLVEYAPISGDPYEHPQLESVDYRGYVIDDKTPTGRDLMQLVDFISDTEEGYLQ